MLFEKACDASSKVKAAFGRMEKFKVKDKEVCILLVKNPAGLDRSLQFVADNDNAGCLYLLLNSNFADGKDVSWIWDVDFESKAEDLPENIYVSGQRYADMNLRVRYCGREVNDKGDETRMKDIFDKALEEYFSKNGNYSMWRYWPIMGIKKDHIEVHFTFVVFFILLL